MKIELIFNETKELIGRYDVEMQVKDIFNNLYKVGEIIYEPIGHGPVEPYRIYCEEIKPINCEVKEL